MVTRGERPQSPPLGFCLCVCVASAVVTLTAAFFLRPISSKGQDDQLSQPRASNAWGGGSVQHPPYIVAVTKSRGGFGRSTLANWVWPSPTSPFDNRPQNP
jgi:hypothetical protein